MGLIDRDSLRASHERIRARLAAEPGFGLMRPEVHARLTRDVSVESDFIQYGQSFTFRGDEAVDRGGHETGPSPMRYFLSGLAFCVAGWCAKGAALRDVPIESLELRLRTLLDMRGEHGLDDQDAAPRYLVIGFEIASPAPTEDVLAVVDFGLEHCPLSALVRSAIPVHQRVTLNGRVILDAVPAEAA